MTMCVETILADVFNGDRFGFHEDDDQSSQGQPDEQKPENKPPSS